MERKIPTQEEVESRQIDWKQVDYWMAKHYNMYRIADTWVYIGLMPERFTDEYIEKHITIMNLSYIYSDWVCKYQVLEMTEDNCVETLERLMRTVGNKQYCPTVMADEVLANNIGYARWDNKDQEEGKKWLQLSKDKEQRRKDAKTITTEG